MAKYSIYNTLSYCESTATRRPQLSVLDSFRSVPQFWQQFLHCAGVTVEVPVEMQACAFFLWVLEESIHVSVCFRKRDRVATRLAPATTWEEPSGLECSETLSGRHSQYSTATGSDSRRFGFFGPLSFKLAEKLLDLNTK